MDITMLRRSNDLYNNSKQQSCYGNKNDFEIYGKKAVCTIINDFFKEYPGRLHFDLLYDVISICALDEKSGISDNRKFSLVAFLERCDKLLLAIQATNTSPKTHQNQNLERNNNLKQSVSLLYQPFFDKVFTSENIENRSKYDQHIDFKAARQLSGKHLQLKDIATRFFIRYGLKEAFDLLVSLKSAASDRNEAVKFKRDLKYRLLASYTIYKEETAQSHIKQKGECYAK